MGIPCPILTNSSGHNPKALRAHAWKARVASKKYGTMHVMSTVPNGDNTLNAPAETSQNEVVAPQQVETTAEMPATTGDIERIYNELSAMKEYIMRMGEQSDRWREGYDLAKRRELLLEFCNWHNFLGRREMSAKSDAAREEVAELRKAVELSMENFSVKIICPPKGDDYAEWRGRAKKVGIVETNDEAKNNKIALVALSGMLYLTGEGTNDFKVVRPAHVKIWQRLDTPRKDPAERNQVYAAPRMKKPVGPQNL